MMNFQPLTQLQSDAHNARVIYDAQLDLTVVNSQELFFNCEVPSRCVVLAARFGFLGSDATQFERPAQVEICAYGHQRAALRWSEPEILRGFLLLFSDRRGFIPADQYDHFVDANGLWTEAVRARLLLDDFLGLCQAPCLAFSLSFDPEIFPFEPEHFAQLNELARFIERGQ